MMKVHEGRPARPTRTATPDSPAAWTACGLSLIALFVTFGLAYSYGVFFSSIADEFNAERAGAAGLFSLTSLLFFGLGCITGPLSDRFGPRPLLIAGGLIIAAGLAGTARAASLGQAYLSYGLGIGIGVSCIYVPIVAAVGRWFERARTLALGVAVSGIGLGTLSVAPLSAWMIEQFGWRSVYNQYAVVAAGVLLVAGLLYPRPARGSREGASGGEARPWLSRRFGRLYAATVLLNSILYVPFVHLPPAAMAIGIDRVHAGGLVGAIGIASVAGRLAIGPMGDRLPQLVLYKSCFVLISASFLLWLAASDYVGLLLFSMVIGAGYGAYIALTPAVLARQFGLHALGRLLGVLYTAVGLGAAMGPLLTGFGVDLFGSYTQVLMLLIGIGLLSVAAIVPARN